MNSNKNISVVEKIDKRLSSVKTGDIAISTRDDVSGIFITYFTFSLYQHTAIFVWLDRFEYENNSKILIKAKNDNNDILAFVHITKRRMHDLYTNEVKSGLVLCNIDEYCKKNLITIWNRPLSELIDDKTRVNNINTFIEENSRIIEYENDIRTILGVPLNIPYQPYPHRMICTTMICYYLESSYGYPFLLSDKDNKLEEREVDFDLPKHPYSVYKAKDFRIINNKSPALSKTEEEIVYGGVRDSIKISTFHPINIIAVAVLLIIVLIVFIYVSNHKSNSI